MTRVRSVSRFSLLSVSSSRQVSVDFWEMVNICFCRHYLQHAHPSYQQDIRKQGLQTYLWNGGFREPVWRRGGNTAGIPDL